MLWLSVKSNCVCLKKKLLLTFSCGIFFEFLFRHPWTIIHKINNITLFHTTRANHTLSFSQSWRYEIKKNFNYVIYHLKIHADLIYVNLYSCSSKKLKMLFFICGWQILCMISLKLHGSRKFKTFSKPSSIWQEAVATQQIMTSTTKPKCFISARKSYLKFI